MKVQFERSAIKSGAILMLRLAVFLAAAYLNILWGYRFFDHSNFILYSWGLIFGIVVLVWQVRSFREVINVRSVAFLLAAALIWLLVFTLSSLVFSGVGHPVFFPGIVALGTILLGSTHARALGASKRRVLIAIPSILGIWCLYAFLVAGFVPWDFILNYLHIPHNPHSGLLLGLDVTEITINLFGVGQTVWQAAYLLCMFSPRPYWIFPRISEPARSSE